MRRLALTLGPSTGGIGRHVAGLAALAAQSDYEVWVAGPGETLSRFGLDAGAYGVVDLASGGWLGELGRVVSGCNIVHAHGLRAGAWTGLATPWRSPYLVTWHNQRQHGGRKGRVDRLAERYVSRRADLNLCVSADLAEMVRSHKGSVRLAPLGPPLLRRPSQSRDRIRSSIKVPVGAKLVLALARLHPQKGLDVLIEAMRELPLPTVLVVAGVGPAEEQLKEQAIEAKLDVRWLGSRNDISNLLLAADVMAMPSRWEGSPFALHEAFQAGTPVVASSVGGIPALANGAASLVPPEDANALRRALVDVLTNAELAALMSEGGVLALDNWPDERGACESVLALYDRILAGHR